MASAWTSAVVSKESPEYTLSVCKVEVVLVVVDSKEERASARILPETTISSVFSSRLLRVETLPMSKKS